MELDYLQEALGVAVEVNGDYWHSDELSLRSSGVTARERHQRKLNVASTAGVRLLFVWESDWRRRRREVEEALRVAVIDGDTGPLLSVLSKG